MTPDTLLLRQIHPNFIQLVRLIKNHHPRIGQQLGHAAFFHRHVGKKQMVVDHDHVARQRLFASLGDVAFFEICALRAQAIFPS